MDIFVKTDPPEKVPAGTLVVGAFADGSLPAATAAVDQASRGRISAALKRGDLEPRAGTALLLPDLAGVASERVLLVSLGPRGEFGEKAFRDCVSSAARTLAGGTPRDAAVALADLDVSDRSSAWRLEQAARLLADGAYRFDGRRLTGSAAPIRNEAR